MMYIATIGLDFDTNLIKQNHMLLSYGKIANNLSARLQTIVSAYTIVTSLDFWNKFISEKNLLKNKIDLIYVIKNVDLKSFCLKEC